jgi:hypothetical protein
MKSNQINIGNFIGEINAYKFSFMDKSVTGRLIECNDEILTVELKSGSRIVAALDSLEAIWGIRQKQEAV